MVAPAWDRPMGAGFAGITGRGRPSRPPPWPGPSKPQATEGSEMTQAGAASAKGGSDGYRNGDSGWLLAGGLRPWGPTLSLAWAAQGGSYPSVLARPAGLSCPRLMEMMPYLDEILWGTSDGKL